MQSSQIQMSGVQCGRTGGYACKLAELSSLDVGMMCNTFCCAGTTQIDQGNRAWHRELLHRSWAALTGFKVCKR